MWMMYVEKTNGTGGIMEEELYRPTWMINASEEPLKKRIPKRDEGEAKKVAEAIIQNFNATLRPNESARKLVKVVYKQ